MIFAANDTHVQRHSGWLILMNFSRRSEEKRFFLRNFTVFMQIKANENRCLWKNGAQIVGGSAGNSLAHTYIIDSKCHFDFIFAFLSQRGTNITTCLWKYIVISHIDASHHTFHTESLEWLFIELFDVLISVYYDCVELMCQQLFLFTVFSFFLLAFAFRRYMCACHWRSINVTHSRQLKRKKVYAELISLKLKKKKLLFFLFEIQYK